ncbi:MAG: hypothetical protein OXT70_01095 [Chloroflexota bacterium]|nr:hypothetical protein [Chloroflexota bacterium]
MSTSYVVSDLQPVIGVFSEPGVDYDAEPVFDDDNSPIYPPDGSVQLTFSTEHGNTGINLTLEQAEKLWGEVGNTIQAVKHQREPVS